jgi:hypothetical protein
MPERRRHQPAPRHGMNAAGTTPRNRGMSLHVPERVRNRPVVRPLDRTTDPLVADAEQDAHALRRRERQVEAGDARLPAAAEHRPGRWMLAAEAQQRRAGAHPLAGRFGSAEVVVLHARADRAGTRHRPMSLLEVVAGLASRELSDREHRHRLSRRTARLVH